MNKEQMIELLHSRMKSCGYIYHVPMDICDTNSNTLYIGSSTNTYLEEIQNKTLCNKMYTIQPCLKTQNLKHYDYILSNKVAGIYKSFFDMFGTMKHGKLNNNDLKDFFQILVEIFQFSSKELVVIIPKSKENFKNYIINELNIKKVKIVSEKRFTKWKYGVSGLTGTAIVIYSIYNNALVQLLDIVEIYNERSNEFYVECCFAIDNMRIKNREYDMWYDLYEVDVNELNNYEFVFWDSLVVTCELFSEGITLPNWKENYQRSHIFKRYIKYMLACNEKIMNTDEQIYQYIQKFLVKKGVYEKTKYIELANIIKKVRKNMLVSQKCFKKYYSTHLDEEPNELKQKYGIIEIK